MNPIVYHFVTAQAFFSGCAPTGGPPPAPPVGSYSAFTTTRVMSSSGGRPAMNSRTDAMMAS
jgi:hypothetical protein